MSDDVIRCLDVLEKFGRQLSEAQLEEAARNNAREIIIMSARSTLLELADAATRDHKEFGYEPLRQHLLNNLRKDEHYQVSPDLSSIDIFDPEIAGTAADMTAGQQAAWASNNGTDQQRLYCWKYGIYKPSVEGMNKQPQFEDYPTYEEILDKRLSTWGDKAPYWYFIEYGNVSGGEAYPSFSGAGFVEETRMRAQEFLVDGLNVAIDMLRKQLDSAIEKQSNNLDNVVKMEITRIPTTEAISGRKVSYERRVTKKAGVWYMLVVGGLYAGKVSM